LAEKVPLVIEILARKHRGSFLDTLYIYASSVRHLCSLVNQKNVGRPQHFAFRVHVRDATKL